MTLGRDMDEQEQAGDDKPIAPPADQEEALEYSPAFARMIIETSNETFTEMDPDALIALLEDMLQKARAK
jgi:hypothetical protein